MSRFPHAILWASLLMSIGHLAAEDRTGEVLFEKRCAGCHALDSDKVGPRLRGVFGRHAAAAPGFNYSPALKNSHVNWDEPALQKWLQDPETLVPDSDMAFRLENGEERSAIIAYLKHLAAK